MIKCPITGFLCVGAHHGQELETLTKYSSNIIAFEPQKNVFQILQGNASRFPGVVLENIALGSKCDLSVEMFKEHCNAGQSSSFLEPGIHLSQYPWCVFDGKESVPMTTLDRYMSDKTVKPNILLMDVQGYELEVLKGSTEYLKNIDYVYCEVNRAEVYKNCAKIEELDLFLGNYNFSRIHTDWSGGTWGDALYELKRGT